MYNETFSKDNLSLQYLPGEKLIERGQCKLTPVMLAFPTDVSVRSKANSFSSTLMQRYMCITITARVDLALT